MASSDAFAVGYGLNLVGTYFDGASMLMRCAADDVPAEIAAAAREQLQGWARQAAQAQAQIKRVDRALADAGVASPDHPTTPDAYQPWADAVAEGYYAALGGEAAAAYVAGSWLGNWVLSANLLAVALYLQTEGDSEVVDWYVGTYGAGVSGAVDGLRGALAEGGLPNGAVAAANGAIGVMATVKPASDDALDQLQAALEALTAHVDAVQGALP